MNILTEEELNNHETTEDDLKELGTTIENVSIDAADANKIIASHRAIQERNRNLVLENDEQTAEIEKLKQIIINLDKHLDFCEPAIVGDLGLEDVTEINQAFKEAYRIVNPDQAAINEALEERIYE